MFHKTINLVKFNYMLKKKYTKIILNKNDMKIIKIFLQLNVISLVKKDTESKKKNLFIIYFKYL